MRNLPSALVMILLILTASAASASPYLYGIHWYGDPNSNDVEVMAGDKPLWVMETVMTGSDPWWTMPGQLSKFQTIAAKGHTVVIRIQPDWGQTIPTPENRQAFLSELAAAAEQAAGFCRFWQIGNEMNLYEEYGGAVLTAEDYADFYKDARAAIKSVSSPLGEQMVLVGPVSPGEVVANVRHTAGNVYLRRMAEALDPSEVDGFALHSYGAPWFDGAAAAVDFMSGVESQLRVIDEEGFCEAPAFILEWNRQTNPPSNADQEEQTAKFLMEAYRRLDEWNRTSGRHPIVCATWFIYPDEGGWANFSILHMKGQSERGVGLDLWDSFQWVTTQNYAAGSMTPEPCGAVPTPTPAPTLNLERGQVASTASFPYPISSEDAINGVLAQRRLGGFHEANTAAADQEPAFTDGAGQTGGVTGLLRDFPGEATPAWSGVWALPNAPRDLTEVRVYTSNTGGRDDRVFHNYDLYVTDAANPGVASPWTLAAQDIFSAPLGTVNANAQYAATWTRLTRQGGPIARSITGIRLDMYAAGSQNLTFVDEWNAGSSGDQDSIAAAFVSPLLIEVDAFTADPTTQPEAGEGWMLY